MTETVTKEVLKPVANKAKERVCAFCKSKTGPKWENFEDLRQYLSPRGRILSRSVTYVCVKHQRRLAEAVKRARHLALLPFVAQEI